MARVPGPVLRTERLVLAVPKMSDVDSFYRYACDRRVVRHLAWDGPKSRQDIVDMVPRSRRQQRAGAALRYILHGRESGEAIGICGLRQIDRHLHRSTNIGYWLARPYWGRGLMPEALRAVVRHAIGGLGLHRVEADVFPNNRRSIALLEGLGFQNEGRARHALCKRGRFRDALQFALLATDPAARRLMRELRR